jgi:hypothetical protein
VDLLEVLRDVALAQVGAEVEVLADGEGPEEAAILGDDRQAAADALRYRATRDVLARDGDGARPGADDPEHRLERRRLARGVAAQQAHELALADVEVDPLEDPDLAVVGGDSVEREQHPRQPFVEAVPRPR